LRGDADATLVQNANGVLVPLTLLAEKIAARDLDVVKGYGTGAARLDAQLLLLLGDGETLGALFYDEG